MTFRKNMLFAAMALSLAACSGADKNQQAQNGQADPNGVNELKAGEVSKRFDFSGFTGVELTSGDDVRVNQGADFSVVAVGPAADVEQLQFRIEQGRLIIGRKSPSAAAREVDIEVMMPKIDALIVTGSGDLTSDRLTGDKVDLTVTGTGDLKMEGGRVTTANLRLTGSGDLDAERMAAEVLTIQLTGSGDIDASASRTAAITLNGSGDVDVKGGAKCTINKAGTGTAECK